MTKQEFLGAMNEIDDEFINEALLADYNEPEVVYLTNVRVPFWKIALPAVVAVCVFFAGVFAAVRLQLIQLPETPTSEPAEVSEPFSPFSNPANSAASEPAVVELPEYDGTFSFSLEGREDLYYGISGAVTKFYDWNTPALVRLYSGNISPDNTVYLRITASAENPEDYFVSGEVRVASLDGEAITIPYNISAADNLNYAMEHGKKVYLYVATDSRSAEISGSWKP